jgi:predicted ArsR family transcriptional regulator
MLEVVLSERGYEPFHDKDGVIRLRNCPSDRLVEAHRQTVCGMNLALLEEAAASPNGTLRAMLDPQPGLCCVALVRNDERSKRRRATRT